MELSDKAAAEQLALRSPSRNEVIMEFTNNMNFQGIIDEHITIIDLSAKIEEQNHLLRGVLVKFLDKPEMSLPATVKTIDLLYSNVEKQYGLSQAAYDTSAYFRDKYHRDVTVRHVHNPELYQYTILVPPGISVASDVNDKPGWRLYGFNDQDLVNVDSDEEGPTIGFDGFLKIINERKLKPFWEGNDIRDYLSKDAQRELARPVHKDESSPPEQRENELQVSSSEGSVVPEYKRSISPFFESKESKRCSSEIRDRDEQQSKYPRVVKDEENGKLTIIMPLSPESEKLAEDFCRQCRAQTNQTISTTSGKAPT